MNNDFSYDLTEKIVKKEQASVDFRISELLLLVGISNSAEKKNLNFTIFSINCNNR